MATLYELVPAYKSVMDEIEANPEEADKWLDTLDSINCAIEVKTDGYVKMMKMLQDTEGMKKEAKRLADRAKAQENLANKLKERLQYAMELIGRDKIKTELFTVSLQANPVSVDDYEPELIPEKYKRKTLVIDLDRQAIKQAIQNGESVPGACLKTSKSIRIR